MLRRVMSQAHNGLARVSTRLSSTQIKDLEEKLLDNPYFIKFKDRIAALREKDPETYVQRLELMLQQHEKHAKAAEKVDKDSGKSLDEITSDQASAAAAQPSYVAPKSLDSIMKVDRLADKTTKEITELWRNFHAHRSSVFATMSKQYWDYFVAIKMHFPVFVYPLPRDGNRWLFYVGQWGGNEINFTSLEHFKLNGPDAPVLLTLCHYPDLIETKGITLMVGDVDESLISKLDAQLLATYVQYFHTEPRGMSLIQTFNTKPESFKYDDVIKAVETIGQ